MFLRYSLPVSLCAATLLIASCMTPSSAQKKPAGGGNGTLAGELAGRNNRFGLELMQKLHKEGENVFISPTSVSTALQMTAGGAKGETRDEMVKMMHVEGLTLPEHNQALLKELNSHEDFKLSVANSLWSDKERVTLNDEFVKECNSYFDAEVRTLNFGDKASVDVINNWISDKTNKKITNMLDEIPSDAISYLVNAVHFKGGWSYKFDAKRTKEADFTLNDGKKKKVQMMHLSEDGIRYLKNADFTAVGLPFGEDRKAVMWVILPSEGQKLAALVSKLSTEDFKKMARAHGQNGNVAMPRFALHYKTLLNDSLKQLGMNKAFGGGDFTRFGSSPMGDIYVGRVIHQSVLEVNEEGAEAAAATIVEMKVESAPAKPFEFRADRPFAVAIVDSETESILFCGAVYEPEELK